MIKTIVGLAFAGIALTPFAEKGTAPAELPGVDMTETSAMSSDNRLVYYAAAQSGAHCRILVDLTGLGSGKAKPEADCAGVFPGLETVAQWSPTGEDTVRLNDAAGLTVLELGASDGFAYEAVSSDAAQVTFSEIDA